MLRLGAIATLIAASSLLLSPSTAEAKPRPKKNVVHRRKAPKLERKATTPIPRKEPPLTVTPPEAPQEEEPPKVDEEPRTEEVPIPAAPPPPADPIPTEPVATESPRRLELGGRLFSYFRTPFSFQKPIQQVSTSAWLEARARMSEGTFANLAVVGDLLTPSAEGKVEGRARLREAFVGAHKDGIEARVGQQIISWGNSDLVHAVDFLTAQDYTFFSVSSDARQIGAPSVMLSYAPDEGASPLRITTVWQPFFPASRVLRPPDLDPRVVLLDEERGGYSLAQSEVGVKLGWSPGGWDVALIGFRGFNHLAEPYLKAIRPDQVVEVGRRHLQRHAIGTQASMTIDAWVLRFEGAYVVTENHDASNPRQVPTHVDAIAGVERAIGERFRVGVQSVNRWYPRFVDFDSPKGDRPEEIDLNERIARVNARFQNYTHSFRPGATLFVGFTSEDESLELSVAGMTYFVGHDYVIQPMVGYRVLEALKLDAGVQVFGGSLETSLGALRRQGGAFAQATYAF